jgi:hypothetical protein
MSFELCGYFMLIGRKAKDINRLIAGQPAKPLAIMMFRFLARDDHDASNSKVSNASRLLVFDSMRRLATCNACAAKRANELGCASGQSVTAAKLGPERPDRHSQPGW